MERPTRGRVAGGRLPLLRGRRRHGVHEPRTYVEHEGKLDQPTTVGFNHGLGEIVTALLAEGMELTELVEHQSVPWNPLGDEMVLGDDGSGDS